MGSFVILQAAQRPVLRSSESSPWPPRNLIPTPASCSAVSPNPRTVCTFLNTLCSVLPLHVLFLPLESFAGRTPPHAFPSAQHPPFWAHMSCWFLSFQGEAASHLRARSLPVYPSKEPDRRESARWIGGAPTLGSDLTSLPYQLCDLGQVTQTT